jgi:hypothetical protein
MEEPNTIVKHNLNPVTGPSRGSTPRPYWLTVGHNVAPTADYSLPKGFEASILFDFLGHEDGGNIFLRNVGWIRRNVPLFTCRCLSGLCTSWTRKQRNTELRASNGSTVHCARILRALLWSSRGRVERETLPLWMWPQRATMHSPCPEPNPCRRAQTLREYWPTRGASWQGSRSVLMDRSSFPRELIGPARRHDKLFLSAVTWQRTLTAEAVCTGLN